VTAAGRVRTGLSALTLASLLAWGATALAEPTAREPLPEDLATRPVTGFAALDRPTGIAEVGFGWLTLPRAQVCAVNCSRGDTSFEVDVWQLYRASRRWALGAGILLALIPTNDASEANRTRRYMTIEGGARYYPYVGENVEWWFGLTGGLVVVSDSFLVAHAPSDRALLGPTGETIRTEGGSLGLAGGPVISLARHWTCGVTLRYAEWFLPERAAVDALGNQASLVGQNVVISLGMNVAYRMAL
jgi:hypothetical protein